MYIYTFSIDIVYMQNGHLPKLLQPPIHFTPLKLENTQKEKQERADICTPRLPFTLFSVCNMYYQRWAGYIRPANFLSDIRHFT